MSMLWLLGLMLVCAALFFVWIPVLGYRRKQHSLAVSQKALNIQACQSQIAELEAEVQAGRLESVEFEEIKAELERNLLSDVSGEEPKESAFTESPNAIPALMAVMLSLFIVAAGSGLYFELGRSGTLKEMEVRQDLTKRLIAAAPDEQIKILEEEAQSNPENPETWYALAQGYTAVSNFPAAESAYEKLIALTNHPEIMGEYAQMLFFLNNNQVTPKVKRLAANAVQSQPDNAPALGLLGIDAFNNEQFDQAANYWQSALAVNPEGASADALRAGIAQAQTQALQSPSASAVDENSVSISVDVSLDQNLLARVTPESFVFVLARALNGPRMPLAVKRIQVKDLPARVVLNDAMAMMPEMTISSFEQVQLIARVSMSGSPAANPGDLEGSISPINVKTGETSINIIINNVVE